MEALFALIGVVIGLLINFWTHRENLSVKMVEIALGILAAEPEKTKGLRNWAVNTLARYSEVPLIEDEKNALREKQLPVYADAVFAARGVGRMGARALGAEGDSFAGCSASVESVLAIYLPTIDAAETSYDER